MRDPVIDEKLQTAIRSLEEIRELLFDCSKECVKADNNRKWETAEALFSLAKSTDLLRRQISGLTNNSHTSSNVETPIDIKVSAAPETKVSEIKVPAKPTKKRKEDYPKFSIRGGALIKTGLSRDRRTEYEQIVPNAEYEKLITRLSSMSSSHKEFVAEEVQEDLECPMYQIYTVLALLRNTGLLDLPRRGTYRFHAVKTFAADVKAVWSRVNVNALGQV
jgi:hypothetical protein